MFNSGLPLSLRNQRPLSAWKGILDLLTSTAAFATELRLLSKIYKGPLVQVRRSLIEGGSVTSITRVGNTATVVFSAAHTFTAGDSAQISGATQSEYNIVAPITVISPTSISYSVVSTATTPATGSPVVNKLKDFYPIAKAAKPTGRYVMLRRTVNDYFDISEIEVFSSGVNVALNKSVSVGPQGFYTGYPLTNLVDGNTATSIAGNTASSNSWVQVDLGAQYSIEKIRLSPRTEFAASVRLTSTLIWLDANDMTAGAGVTTSNAAPQATSWLFGTTSSATITTPQTFALQADRWIDTAAVLSFTGSGNGYVVTGYDQTLGSSAALANGWIADTNASLTIVNGALRVTTTNGSNGEIYRGFPTVIGLSYTLTLTQSIGTSYPAAYVSNNAPNALTGGLGYSIVVGAVSISFVASAASTYLRLENAGGTTGIYSDYKNIKLVEFNGGVSTAIYDSSVGNNVTQTDITRQPVIVSSGVFNTLNGRPIPAYNGSRLTSLFNIPQPMFAMSTANISTGDADGAILFDSYSSSNAMAFYRGTGGDSGGTFALQANSKIQGGAVTTTGANVLTAQMNSSSSGIYLNGTSIGSGSIGSGSLIGLSIGDLRGNPTPIVSYYSLLGSLSGLVVMQGSSQTDRLLLERNAGAAYGITVA